MVKTSYKITAVMALIISSAMLSFASLKINEDEERLPETNLQIIQNILGNLAETILTEASLPSEATIGLKVRKTTESWITEQALSDRIISHRYNIIYTRDSDTAAPYIFTVGDAEARVKYSNPHRLNLFGRKRVERSVTVFFQSQIYESQTGKIRSGKMQTSEYRDTVYTDDISFLENADIPMTKAELPDESFIDRFIEPIIIVGTAGIAVFLFFHIRS
jgi:hypothetical protein